jgi:hypothetical protein
LRSGGKGRAKQGGNPETARRIHKITHAEKIYDKRKR